MRIFLVLGVCARQRFHVPEDKVKWSVDWPEYEPTYYTSPTLLGQPWADLEIEYEHPKTSINLPS